VQYEDLSQKNELHDYIILYKTIKTQTESGREILQMQAN
jgi:hypothetical protein